jgi:gamma-glutamylcyclotransferase (GGCT)/AIG2-like uncharacterized protein YtfP
MLAGLRGRWTDGVVHGDYDAAGWGRTGGYPGLVWRPGGAPLHVRLFESQDLPAHWERLDAFEGPAYRRRVVPVMLPDGGRVLANLYALDR